MKPVLLFLLQLIFCCSFAQNIPSAIWEDQVNGGYYYVKLDASTGIKTNVSLLPTINGFVAGDVSAINTDSNYYHFAALSSSNYVFFTLDLTTGAIIYNPIYTTILVGVEYSCADHNLYAIRVTGNTYDFVIINPANAQITFIANIPNITGYVGGSFSLDFVQRVYTFKALTPTGYRLKSINIQTGAVIYDNPFPDNVAGHKYSPADSAVYGLWDDNNQYKLEKINYVNGTHSTVSVLAGVTPGFVTESQSMNVNGEYTFRGFSGSNFAVFSVDVTTGAILNNNLTADNAVGFEEPACTPGPSSVNEVEENFYFSVYPNPANTTLTVIASLADGGVNSVKQSHLTIFNTLGEEVGNWQLTIGKNEINVCDCPKGIYFLQLTSGDKVFSQKIIIE